MSLSGRRRQARDSLMQPLESRTLAAVVRLWGRLLRVARGDAAARSPRTHGFLTIGPEGLSVAPRTQTALAGAVRGELGRRPGSTTDRAPGRSLGRLAACLRPSPRLSGPLPFLLDRTAAVSWSPGEETEEPGDAPTSSWAGQDIHEHDVAPKFPVPSGNTTGLQFSLKLNVVVRFSLTCR